METAKVTQRNKVLESENKLLLSEMDQLRDVSVVPSSAASFC